MLCPKGVSGGADNARANNDADVNKVQHYETEDYPLLYDNVGPDVNWISLNDDKAFECQESDPVILASFNDGFQLPYPRLLAPGSSSRLNNTSIFLPGSKR